jgi:hypothetical protein
VPSLNLAHGLWRASETGPHAAARRPAAHRQSRPNPAMLTAHSAGATRWARSSRGTRARGGASTEGSSAARLPWVRGRGQEGGGRGVPGKVGNGVTHRGGRALGRDRRDGVVMMEGGRTVAGDAPCYPAVQRVGGRGEAKPKWGKNGEERAWRHLSPWRGDDIGGAAEFSVWGGALMVGVVEKVTGRGVLPVGCFGVRTKGGGGEGTEARRRRAAPF